MNVLKLMVNQYTAVLGCALIWGTTFCQLSAQPLRPSTAGPRVERFDTFRADELSDSHGTVIARRIWVALPKSYTQGTAKRYPVLYTFDGQNLFDNATSYIGEWGIDEAMDSLGLEVIVVGLDNGGGRRAYEYIPFRYPSPLGLDLRGRATGGGQLTFDWLLKRVKPWIDHKYRTNGTQFLCGSSLGGLMALYGQVTYPEVFSGAINLSGAYTNAPAMYTYARRAKQGIRVYHIAGYREWEPARWGEVIDDMHRMADTLRAHGVNDQVLVADPRGEHNEQFWRRVFPDAALWLLKPSWERESKK